MPLQPLAPYKTPRRAAATQTAQLFNVPAPIGGLNLRDPISAMSPIDAVTLDNMIPRQTGVEMRGGYQVHTNSILFPIKSVFSYNAPNPANNKLFAAANGKIYDVTTNPATVAVALTNSTEDYWSTTQFSTGGDTFLLCVSPGAGYWTYSTTSGWINRTPAGLPTTTLKTVSVWKQRVFFTCEADTRIYYFHNVNVVDGNTSPFTMGAQLRNGGYIAGLINWTLDAGVGIDDHLVVIGSQGDVAVWQGTDPQNANDFALRGIWYCGPVPKYGRFFTSFGGDVMILSDMGLVPLSKLVNGQFVETTPGPAQKIQTLLSPLVSDLISSPTWDIFIAPASEVMVIKVPNQVSGGYRQFAMNVNTASWCTFSGLPMHCTTILNGVLYFGTDDGTVCKGLYGSLDGVLQDDTGGSLVEGDVQTAFNAFDTPGLLKRFGLVRPIFIAPEVPSVKARVNTQYAFTGVEGSPSFTNNSEALWDAALWNDAAWVGTANTYQAWVGTTGLGYYGSLRMKVRGASNTIFTSSHFLVDVGGMM